MAWSRYPIGSGVLSLTMMAIAGEEFATLATQA